LPNEYVLIESMIGWKLGKRKKRAVPIAALLLLCLLWSLSSLRSDLLPQLASNTSQAPPLARQAFPLALLAVALCLLSVARRSQWPRGKVLLASALIGIGLFVAPAVLVFLARNWVSDLTRVALFSLAPVFAVIFEPYLGRLNAAQSRTGLLASLVALAGSLLLFPVDLPQSVQAAGAFAAVVLATACVAAANCWAVRVASELPQKSILPFAAVAAASATIGILAASAIVERPQWQSIRPDLLLAAWSAAEEVPALWLLFWLMRHISATRMTTRFLLAPLITNFIGIFLLRPAVSLREGLGLLLVACGAGWLLFANEDETEMPGSSLNLDFD
jgi:drug/metabolite transporter (DMT)-like permease